MDKNNVDFVGVKKILLIKLRHIGDVLLTVPTIRAVRETFPEAYIAALVNKGTEDMLTENPLLDEVIVYDRGIQRLPFSKRIKKEFQFIRCLRSKGFDMTIDLTSGDRPAIYSYLSAARYRLGYDPEGQGFRGKRYVYTHRGKRLEGRNHTALQHLHLVRQSGMDTNDLSVNVFFSEEERQYVDKILSNAGVKPSDPIIHIHPTSRWLFKCWSDGSMAGVIDYIQKSGIKAVITSSPEEQELQKVKLILEHTKSMPVNLSGRLTLKHLAALSKKAILFFGIDSAPMHIAAAVGTPVVALFGPSGVFDWGPWNNKSSEQLLVNSKQLKPYKNKNGVQSFGAHNVIQKDWDCVPCGKDGCNGSKKSKCLEEIEVEEVIETIRSSRDVYRKLSSGKI